MFISLLKTTLWHNYCKVILPTLPARWKNLLELRDFRQLVKVFLKRQEVEKNDVRRVPQLVYDLKKYYPRQFADFQAKSFEMHKGYIIRYLELGVSQGLVRANLKYRINSRSVCKDS